MKLLRQGISNSLEQSEKQCEAEKNELNCGEAPLSYSSRPAQLTLNSYCEETGAALTQVVFTLGTVHNGLSVPGLSGFGHLGFLGFFCLTS